MPPADSVAGGMIAQSGAGGHIQADDPDGKRGDRQGLVKPVLVVSGASLARKKCRT